LGSRTFLKHKLCVNLDAETVLFSYVNWINYSGQIAKKPQSNILIECRRLAAGFDQDVSYSYYILVATKPAYLNAIDANDTTAQNGKNVVQSTFLRERSLFMAGGGTEEKRVG
jgi:hypothetical protein